MKNPLLGPVPVTDATERAQERARSSPFNVVPARRCRAVPSASRLALDVDRRAGGGVRDDVPLDRLAVHLERHLAALALVLHADLVGGAPTAALDREVRDVLTDARTHGEAVPLGLHAEQVL